MGPQASPTASLLLTQLIRRLSCSSQTSPLSLLSKAALSITTVTNLMLLFRFRLKLIKAPQSHQPYLSAHQPYVASSYLIGQHNYRTFPSAQKVLLDGDAVILRSAMKYLKQNRAMMPGKSEFIQGIG